MDTYTSRFCCFAVHIPSSPWHHREHSTFATLETRELVAVASHSIADCSNSRKISSLVAPVLLESKQQWALEWSLSYFSLYSPSWL